MKLSIQKTKEGHIIRFNGCELPVGTKAFINMDDDGCSVTLRFENAEIEYEQEEETEEQVKELSL